MTDLSFARAALEAPSRPALLVGGATHTFAEVAARAARLRAALAAEGVGAGARVALVARNSLDTALAVYALAELGATIVPIHPRLTPSEADVLLADAAPRLVLREDDLAPLPRDTRREEPLLEPVADRSALAMVYTSGTTGRPKGAVLSRRAFVAAAEASARNLGFHADDRWLCAMPLCHVGGLSILTRCLLARSAVILEPRFDPDAVLAAIVRDHATLLSVVPTMLEALLARDAANVLARLRAMLVGGAGAPFALLEECGRRGVPALTTYGLTEACSQVTAQRPTSPYRPERGSGVPLPGTEVRIDGEGHILVRGPTLMDGYFRGADRAPDTAVDGEGWLDTGDLGEQAPGGALHVHARRSDLVVTGGENVYPVEVEERLAALPGVRRALVFGVPDARWGQIVAAALELAPGVDLDALHPGRGDPRAPQAPAPLLRRGRAAAHGLRQARPRPRGGALRGRAPALARGRGSALSSGRRRATVAPMRPRPALLAPLLGALAACGGHGAPGAAGSASASPPGRPSASAIAPASPAVPQNPASARADPNPLRLSPTKVALDTARRVFTVSDEMLASARPGSTLVLYAAMVTAIEGDDLIIEGRGGPSYRVQSGYVIPVPDEPRLNPGDAVLTERDGVMRHAVVTRFVRDRVGVRYTDLPGRPQEALLLGGSGKPTKAGPSRAARFMKQVDGLLPGNYAVLRQGSEWLHVLLVSASGEGDARRWFALAYGGAAMVVREADLKAIPVRFTPKPGAVVSAQEGGKMRRATVQSADDQGIFTVKFERAGRPATLGWGLLTAPLEEP